MNAEAKDRTLQRHREIVGRITDVKRAINLLGFNEAVIEKFSDELTLEDFLTYARRVTWGPENPSEKFSDDQQKEIEDFTRQTAISWLTLADWGEDTLLQHRIPSIQRFGRRMYIELNPERLSETDLLARKKEWGLS